MAYSKTFTTRNFPPGLVADGTLNYRIVDDANATLVARTNAGITETADIITGLPTYSVTVTLQETWSGRLLWDLFEAQWDEESFSAVTNAPTRTIEFLYETGDPPTPSDTSPAGVAVTSVIVNDVREAATNTLLNAGPVVMTHAGVGRWTLDAVAIGIDPSVAVYYAAAVVYADATSEQYPHLYNAGTGAHYATRQDIESEIGVDNVTIYANLNSLDPASTTGAAEIAANVESALTFADTQINGELAAWSYALPLSGVNGAAIPTWVTNKLRIIAQKLAAWQLGQARDHTQPLTTDQRKDLQNRYDWAMAQLDAMLINTIPATSTVTDDSSPEVGSAGPDVDKQGCPLPTTVCATYGYGGRVYGYC